VLNSHGVSSSKMGDFWVYKKKAEEEEASDALAVAISHAQQTFHCSHNFPFIQFARDLLLLSNKFCPV